MKSIDLSSFSPAYEGLFDRRHYSLAVDNYTLSYCYIRKNACSAFKRYFLSYTDNPPVNGKLLRIMNKNFLDPHPFDKDKRILVLRHPLERFCSLISNKFIDLISADGVLRSFLSRVNKNPEDATIRDVIYLYLLGNCDSPLDPHFVHQSSHVLPMVYNVVCSPRHLCDTMIEVVGPGLADRFFQLPANQSQSSASNATFKFDIGIDSFSQLRLESRRLGLYPDISGSMSQEDLETLQNIYCNDYDLWLLYELAC